MTLVQTSPKHIYYGESKIVSDMQGPCPDGFHVPTKDEFQTIMDIGTNLGLWSSSNTSGMKTYLKIPMYGYITGTSSPYFYSGTGWYWSCSYLANYQGYVLCVYSGNSGISNKFIVDGASIRAIKNSPVTPDSSWTALYSNKIYHNSTLGLISLSSNGTNWVTIADKNLGATTVYNSGDAMSESNCGKLYQRGNNYGFPTSGFSIITNTQVDASSYGPGNYYSSDKFRYRTTTPYTWDSSKNPNLRGGDTQGTTEKGTVKAVYLGETKVRPAYKPRTFTISRTEKSDMSSGWTYSDDAAGLTAGDGAFDDFFGYSAVLLNTSGVETAEMKQSGGVFTGAMSTLGNITSGDNVMIKFPVRGIKMSKSGSTVTLSITDEKNKDGYQYYAHTKGSDIKNALYLGAYNMTSGYKSWSGATPLVSQSRATVRSGIKSAYDSTAGTNRYSQITIYPRWYISALYMMKYGSPYSQSVVGQGYTNANTVANTGGTSSQTNATYGNTSNYTTQMRLFGIEDLWGNVNDILDGCYFNSSTQLTVDKTNSVFQDSDYSTNLGTAVGGWLGGIAGTNDAMFMNISKGTKTTYYKTNVSAGSSAVPVSSGYYQSVTTGILYMNVTGTSSTSALTGSRLQYL